MMQNNSLSSHVSIFAREVSVTMRIGLLEAEKVSPQRLLVSMELFAAPEYLDKAREDHLIDYAVIVEAVRAWESRPHVLLIESCLKELLALGFGFASVTAVRARISKPDIFPEAEEAGVEVFMRREDYKA